MYWGLEPELTTRPEVWDPCGKRVMVGVEPDIWALTGIAIRVVEPTCACELELEPEPYVDEDPLEETGTTDALTLVL